MLTEQEAEEFRIRQLVEKWALTRDAGDWDGFASVWHEDGWMTATWFQGPAADFIQASRDGFAAGVNILHFLGGSRCEATGNRAVAQTKMTIQQRAAVHGIAADVTCTGRFYDFLEKRTGGWGIVRRQPIYEKDRVRASIDDEWMLGGLPDGRPVANVIGARSVAVGPILAGDVACGAITVVRSRGGPRLGFRELGILSQIGRLAGVAAERLRS